MGQSRLIHYGDFDPRANHQSTHATQGSVVGTEIGEALSTHANESTRILGTGITPEVNSQRVVCGPDPSAPRKSCDKTAGNKWDRKLSPTQPASAFLERPAKGYRTPVIPRLRFYPDFAGDSGPRAGLSGKRSAQLCRNQKPAHANSRIANWRCPFPDASATRMPPTPLPQHRPTRSDSKWSPPGTRRHIGSHSQRSKLDSLRRFDSALGRDTSRGLRSRWPLKSSITPK